MRILHEREHSDFDDVRRAWTDSGAAADKRVPFDRFLHVLNASGYLVDQERGLYRKPKGSQHTGNGDAHRDAKAS